MQSSFFNCINLKAKMSLAAASLFTLFVIATSYLTFSYFERTLNESISDQQSSLVSSLAAYNIVEGAEFRIELLEFTKGPEKGVVG